MAVAFLSQRLDSATLGTTERARTEFGALTAKLGALNPLNVLARGYAAAFDDDGKPVTRAEGLSAGQNLHIRFADRTADAVIKGVRESE